MCSCVMASQPILYPIRMLDEVRDVLAELMRAGGRSLHAGIIAMLQDAVSKPDALHVEQDMNILAELSAGKVATRLQQGRKQKS